MANKNPLKYLKLILLTVLLIFVSVVTAFIVINNVDYVEVTGEIKPAEYQVISPKISGVIKKCFYKDGEIVRAGNLVMEMDSKEYELDLQELMSKKELQETRILSLEDKLRLFLKEKTFFNSKMSRDLDDLKIKKDNDIISQKEYDDEVYKLYEDNFSKDEKVMSAANELSELKKELKAIASEIESMKDKIEKCSVFSMIDGIVVDEDSRIKEGGFYNSGDVIQKIFANNDAYAEVYIPEKKIIKVELNQKVKIFVDAVPYTRYRTFEGRLVSLMETKSRDDASGYTGKVLIDDPFFRIRDLNDIKTKKLIFGLKLKARIYTGKKSLIDFFLRKED